MIRTSFAVTLVATALAASVASGQISKPNIGLRKQDRKCSDLWWAKCAAQPYQSSKIQLRDNAGLHWQASHPRQFLQQRLTIVTHR